MGAGAVLQTYKDLQEIERCFRVLKFHVRIRPTFHWTEPRVRGHVFLCVIALLVERVMRLKLRRAQLATSPQRALEELHQLMHVSLALPDGTRRQLLANKDPRQLELFEALEAPPLTDAQLQEPAA
jgi:transposase